MKIILTNDVDGLGHKGDVVDVADGYARNYLLPKSFAIKATQGALKEADALRRARCETERHARAGHQYQAAECV